MKTIVYLLVSVLVVSFSPSLSERVSIFDALNKRWIKCVVTANDSFNEGQLSVLIENLHQLKNVVIPSGTRFISESSDEQDFMNVNDELIVLDGKSVEITIDGYCVQKHNSYPTEGNLFTLHKESNEKLVKTAQLMNQKGFSRNIIQSALWSVSDGATFSGIYEKNNEKVEELRAAICALTGREDDWYNTDATYELSETRQIVSEVTKIEGLISYEVKETGSLKMEVCKSDGEVIRTLASSTPVQHLGEYRFNFNLKVQGWERGSYSVRLKINNNVFHEQEFEVG